MIFGEIMNNSEIKALWGNYQRKFDYATDVNWNQVIEAINRLLQIMKL